MVFTHTLQSQSCYCYINTFSGLVTAKIFFVYSKMIERWKKVERESNKLRKLYKSNLPSLPSVSLLCLSLTFVFLCFNAFNGRPGQGALHLSKNISLRFVLIIQLQKNFCYKDYRFCLLMRQHLYGSLTTEHF